MRKWFLAIAVLAMLPAAARAGPLPTAAADGIRAAIEGIDLVQPTACRLRWRCGRYGCGWQRVCWRRPIYGYYHYAPRPRPSYRYRYWHRRWW
ncbi:MAG TPA: hypothetical protein VIH40_09500 [Xanthobacteraceae bacterium]